MSPRRQEATGQSEVRATALEVKPAQLHAAPRPPLQGGTPRGLPALGSGRLWLRPGLLGGKPASMSVRTCLLLLTVTLRGAAVGPRAGVHPTWGRG